jgi:hypothetical protein
VPISLKVSVYNALPHIAIVVLGQYSSNYEDCFITAIKGATINP